VSDATSTKFNTFVKTLTYEQRRDLLGIVEDALNGALPNARWGEYRALLIDVEIDISYQDHLGRLWAELVALTQGLRAST
jgi:hypothetical protein